MSEAPHLKAVGDPVPGYQDLKYHFAHLGTLFSIRGMMAIDMMTAMPAGGLKRRLHDITTVTKHIYEEITSEKITRLLDKAENYIAAHKVEWSEWDAANLAEMRRIHSHLSALPTDLYIASVQTANEGRQRHKDAKGEAWADIAPYLTQTVDLYRRIADLKQKKFGKSEPYEALLLGFAGDISLPCMDGLYDSLMEPLSVLRKKAIEREAAQEPPAPLKGEFSRGNQMWLNKTILEIMGFDFDRGTLQISALGPMAGGTPDDARVLVRCSDGANFLNSLEDTLYQGARGLYIQNLPAEWFSQPVGHDPGALMMNAQSILYETIIGRTPQFFEFISTRAEGVFQEFRNKSFAPENLYRLKKAMKPQATRRNADEMTKIFHDVMRYRIERDLINGSLSVDELPDRWGAECAAYFGSAAQEREDAALQNPDWFAGKFGSIPTKALSHILAASLYGEITAALPDLPGRISFGDFKPVNEWMRDHIHSKGRSRQTLALIEDITGQKLSAAPLLAHLERRYAG